MIVLLGEISSYKAIVIAKYLHESYRDIFLIGYDDRKFTKHLSTKYCSEIVNIVSFKSNKQTHLNTIAEIISKKKVDIFIPVDSEAYGAYVLAKEKFGKALKYIGDYAIYEQLHDKAKFSTLSSGLNIRVPNTYSSLIESKIPFVAKPTNLSSAKGVKYVFSEKKRTKIRLIENSDNIFQEYISGVGCGYSVFAQDGEIISGHGHVRLAEYPVSGGSSVYRESYENVKMLEIVKKILKFTKWSGFAMFEFKLTFKNELVLIEANPRIWGSINQGLQCGTNYFKSLFGEPDYLIKRDVYTYLSPLIYKAFLIYFFRLQLRPILLFIRNIFKNSADISFFHDFKGYISIILRIIL